MEKWIGEVPIEFCWDTKETNNNDHILKRHLIAAQVLSTQKLILPAV